MLDASYPAALPKSDTLANAVLLIFTLSAIHPTRMAEVLRLAYCSLRPGGLLLFRDYAEVSATSILSSPLRIQCGPASQKNWPSARPVPALMQRWTGFQTCSIHSGFCPDFEALCY